MKTLIAIALILFGALLAGIAFAGTTVNFGPATTCPTYCTGFTTDTGDSLDWLNAVYALSAPPHALLSVNGKTYSGNTTATFVAQVGTHKQYQVDGTLTAADGTSLTVSYSLEYWTTKVTSGRDAGRLVPHRLVNYGTITTP